MSADGRGKPAAPGTPVRRMPWPQSASRPLGTPLQPSVAHVSDDPDALDAQYEGRVAGYSYAREGHANADVLAAKIDALEGMSGGLMTGSGMAAVAAVLLGLPHSGDHVIGGTQLYGRSLRLMREDLPRLGIATSLADPTDADALRAAVTPQTKLILVEVVSNPTLRLTDMNGAAAVAREAGALLVVDNTFTTPAALRGIDMGADIVLHSVTKLLAGHSDVTLGYVAARDPEVRQRLLTAITTFGMTPSPWDCWMAERGLHSFALRYDRACATATALADTLPDHAAVARVAYPGREDHPDRARAHSLLRGRNGNMVTFDLAGGRDAANAFVRAAADLPFAPTLGDVATTLSHPASSSHRGLTEAARRSIGITEGTIRVSVGIEETDWVLDRFRRALSAVS